MVDVMIDQIATVGFPIFAYLLLFVDLKAAIKENTAALRDLQTEIRARVQ